jgi:hypothetical protein
MQFVAWLESRAERMIMRDFGKDKCWHPLFIPDASEGKKL